MAEKTTGNVRAHTTYKTADGTRVPSVTTILGILNKPALVKWANNLGLQGIDSSKFVDEKARIGTLAHAMIQAFISAEISGEQMELNLLDYTPNQQKQAGLSYLKFSKWWKENDIEPIVSEKYLISEDYRYGGTIDFFCKLNGEHTLVDFKTSKAIYSDHLYQLAAYETLLAENGYPVDQSVILRIGRDEAEGFEVKYTKDLAKQFTVFHHLREIYKLQNEIRKV